MAQARLPGADAVAEGELVDDRLGGDGVGPVLRAPHVELAGPLAWSCQVTISAASMLVVRVVVDPQLEPGRVAPRSMPREDRMSLPRRSTAVRTSVWPVASSSAETKTSREDSTIVRVMVMSSASRAMATDSSMIVKPASAEGRRGRDAGLTGHRPRSRRRHRGRRRAGPRSGWCGAAAGQGPRRAEVGRGHLDRDGRCTACCRTPRSPPCRARGAVGDGGPSPNVAVRVGVVPVAHLTQTLRTAVPLYDLSLALPPVGCSPTPPAAEDRSSRPATPDLRSVRSSCRRHLGRGVPAEGHGVPGRVTPVAVLQGERERRVPAAGPGWARGGRVDQDRGAARAGRRGARVGVTLGDGGGRGGGPVVTVKVVSTPSADRGLGRGRRGEVMPSAPRLRGADDPEGDQVQRRGRRLDRAVSTWPLPSVSVSGPSRRCRRPRSGSRPRRTSSRAWEP